MDTLEFSNLVMLSASQLDTTSSVIFFRDLIVEDTVNCCLTTNARIVTEDVKNETYKFKISLKRFFSIEILELITFSIVG